ncbi:anaerobic ribonucleoside-triphosphate reductase activating protein [Microbacterium schleiferi]|uniref:Anaerobic ribonucleoside-triphosphate reductase activating protein n=1 Tax=Microbacterium schleiferi TaxID=69362 RepID=A0ABU7V3E5_9MICO
MNVVAPSDAGAGADQLSIAGLTRFSGSDWPDRLVATVFLQGCPWECVYCHNPDLIDPHRAGALPWRDVVTFLDHRRGQLDGVVFSGGEPTMQTALLPAIDDARCLGLRIGLHTGGAFPQRLDAALPALDWVGLDIKASAADYAAVTQRRGSGIHAWRSLRLVLDSASARAGGDHPLEYEVRTTVDPTLTDADRLRLLGEQLLAEGVQWWALQRARDVGTRPEAPSVPTTATTDDLVETIAAEFTGAFTSVVAR